MKLLTQYDMLNDVDLYMISDNCRDCQKEIRESFSIQKHDMKTIDAYKMRAARIKAFLPYCPSCHLIQLEAARA